MKTRIVLATFVLALTSRGVSLPAQEMAQPQIANWPAPAVWEPPGRTSGGLGTENALAVSSSSPMPFIAVTPCRIIDTRVSGGAFAVGETRTYQMSGGALPCVSGFPFGIAAVSLNITVTQTAGTGFVTGFPTGASLPLVVSLTWIGANQTLTNAAVVPTGTSSSINVYASQATHVIFDINGYYGATLTSNNSNVFLGPFAGNATMSGQNNTAIGFGPFQGNTTGTFNTAIGNGALYNTTGNDNTATGAGALQGNQTGSDNTAHGYAALINNSGSRNTASGSLAVQMNTTGSDNTGSGNQALRLNTTGNRNIAIGSGAGVNLTTGDDNIDIGHPGVAGEAAIIRIGNQAVHTTTFIAGIFASFPLGGGSTVFANSNGELSTNSSAGRFKEDIREIGDASEGLMRLRPVAFKYKPEFDPTGLKQYGLIAEEVAQVYPELVLCDRDGKPFTVQYHLVNALLLNEVQKQHRTVETQERKIEQQSRNIESQQAEIERLKADLSALRTLVSQQ